MVPKPIVVLEQSVVPEPNVLPEPGALEIFAVTSGEKKSVEVNQRKMTDEERKNSVA